MFFGASRKQKLQEAYPYDTDGVAYVIWLFRSGRQDEKSLHDNKSRLIAVVVNGDRCVYKALDQGWESTRRIKLRRQGNMFVVNDLEL